MVLKFSLSEQNVGGHRFGAGVPSYKSYEWGGIVFSWVCLSEASVIVQIWLDCHTVVSTCLCDLFGWDVCVCVSVCPHYDLKTIADLCFLTGSYIDWRKLLRQIHTSRSLWRVQGHCVRLWAVLLRVVSKIPSPMTLSSGLIIWFTVRVCDVPVVITMLMMCAASNEGFSSSPPIPSSSSEAWCRLQ